MSETVLVAVIGAVGVVLAGLVQALRRENRQDHAVVADSLNRIENKLDDHIHDHLTGDV